MNLKREIIVVLGFDMETDVGSWTPYYEGLKNGTPLILELLKNKNVKGTFFFTGEAVKINPDVCRLVDSEQHEVGCHSLYHETVGDAIFEIPGVKPLLPEEIKNRLRIATELVENTINSKKILSFRCPRLWGSTEVINSLEELGYISDASYPLYFYEKQLLPYHPSENNWLEKGNLKIVEIPNFADMTIKTKDPYGRDRDQWPLFRIIGAKELMVHINNFIEFLFNKEFPAIICFYFHPWEFIKMPTEFQYAEGTVIPDEFITKNCGRFALKQLGILIDMLLDKNAKFFTARDIALNFKW
ncbi:MAG: polysaccharide deacetylase family protein [Actinobacteria bacterium]|nr:polysaccharide deacetylase family protein [Actinomycetota bacterium]